MLLMEPSVGRLVHYRSDQGCWAALITHVAQGVWIDQDTNASCEAQSVCLEIFKPMGSSFQRTALQGEAEGTWHWPERV